MRNGLKVIRLPGNYYGSVTRVGWLRRINGDEWEIMPGARSIWRTNGDMTSLDAIAALGPTSNHRMTDPQLGIEEVHRLLLLRTIPADPAVWAKHVPKPENWVDDGETPLFLAPPEPVSPRTRKR